ncbi:MAG: sulfotransferase domain-containing protein [Chloroflexaceae bacterium]|nr:sulfotransferase domain-containing protein [Chloroflexaceae bacterium]
MKLLQIGVAKSGNFWLYKVLQSILHESGIEQRSFIQSQPIYAQAQTWQLSQAEQAGVDVLDITPNGCFYRISSVFREPVPDLDAYLNQVTHVWSHSPFCNTSADVLGKFDRVIYIIRDPRDVAISMSRFVFTPYMRQYYPSAAQQTSPEEVLDRQLAMHVGAWALHVGQYLLHRDHIGLYLLFYERMLYDFDNELQRLLHYLGLELDQAARDRIKQSTSFDTMKRQNPGHVRAGRSSGWVDTLTPAQKQRAVRVGAPMLNILQYPLNDSRNAERMLPVAPGVPDQTLRHALLSTQLRYSFYRGLQLGRFALSEQSWKEKFRRTLLYMHYRRSRA